jgi:hypothetical protein
MSESYDPPTSATPSMPRQQASVPNPDPTQRTVEQVQRDIAAVRQVVEASIKGNREVLETRLSGMDKAIELLQTATDRLPDKIRDSVQQLKELHDEKFNSVSSQLKAAMDGIEKQFTERDKRTEQLSLADKTAIAAALQAQKEAAGAQNDSNTTANSKMEANFATLISQTQQLLQEVRRSTDDKIVALGDRLTKGETTIATSHESRSDNRQSVIAWVAVGGLVFAVISGFVGFNLSHFVISQPTVQSPIVSYSPPPPGFRLVPEIPPSSLGRVP